MNAHRCSFKVRNNSKLVDYPCYLFWCNRCKVQLIVTKKTFWKASNG